MNKLPPIPDTVVRLFRYLEAKRDVYIQDLKQIIKIKSISSETDKWDEISVMAVWMENRLKKLGARTEKCRNILRENPTGVERPPVIIGSLGSDKKKKTIVLYGYLDVSPAKMEDGWTSDPFELTERNLRIYGRGVCSNKGAILCWLHVIEVYLFLKIPLPVNFRFVFEGLNKIGSPKLDEFLFWHRKAIFENTECICFANSSWLERKKPCIVYGQRGSCSFVLEVTGASQDMHSGTFAGTVVEPMADLMFILNRLVDHHVKIRIPDLSLEVVGLTPEEENMYKLIELDVEAMRNSLGARRLAHKENKVSILMHTWRYPSLSIHGIEGAFSGPGPRTVIPAKVRAHFTIQIVPNQSPVCVGKRVNEHINSLWDERNSPNRMELKMVDSSFPWSENTCTPMFVAAKRAVGHTYKVTENMIREGGRMPVINILKGISKLPVVLLAFAKGDDQVDGVDENISAKSYIEGHKYVAAYLYELGVLPPTPPKENPVKK